MASLEVDVQIALAEVGDVAPMSEQQLNMWANLAYGKVSGSLGRADSQITIRLVDEKEITQLNSDYRGKNKATNVLSFPVENDFPDLLSVEAHAEVDDLTQFDLLGDVVICHSVIVNEAMAQSKSMLDHYAHMVVHGVLHLCGYDHQDDVSADEMESLEIAILAQREIANPYS